MVEFKVIWSERSLQDLERLHDLLSDASLNSANKTVQAILNRVTQLRQFPKSGPTEPSLTHLKKEHRYLVCGHHKIIYMIQPKAVFIVRVFDTRMHPDKLK